MAEDAVDHAAESAGLPERHADTADLPLYGWVEKAQPGPYAAYGSDAEGLRQIAEADPSLAEPIHERLPAITGAEIVWAAREEMARTAPDALARRTRGLFLDAEASAEVAARVASLIARETGHDAGWEAAQAESVRQLAAGETP
jgi:glycerol-3-phosphate dehydrogenase